MLAQPHTPTTLDRIAPGDRIWNDDAVFVVDEVRVGLTGLTLLGYPPNRVGEGRRASIMGHAHQSVMLLADDRWMGSVYEGLRLMVERANNGAKTDYDAEYEDMSEGPQPTFIPPYDWTGSVIDVRVGGIIWRVPTCVEWQPPTASRTSPAEPEEAADAD